MTTFDARAATDLFRRPPDDLLDVGVARIAHRRVGEGPDVLFVHGWPVSGATFRRLLPDLAPHVTCHVIDLPGAGSSPLTPGTTFSIDNHIAAVRGAVEALGLDRLAVVGHDSGGLIARHALAGDPRVRSMALVNTEPAEPSWRFTSFLRASRLPGFGAALRWASGKPRLRRSRLVLGDAFADPSHLDEEFDELFLAPLRDESGRLAAAMDVIRSFEMRYVRELTALHRRIEVPVRLVWGVTDPFFPVGKAREMASEMPHAELVTIEGAGLFCHEEAPAAVAAALLPALRP